MTEVDTLNTEYLKNELPNLSLVELKELLQLLIDEADKRLQKMNDSN